MKSNVLLMSRRPKPDGTFHRKVAFLDLSEEEDFYVKVGEPQDEGLNLMDDLDVAKLVIKELKSRGWRVVVEEDRTSALFTAEEAAVMNKMFAAERIENEHS